MNKIEELEKQLKEEMSKIQVDLKEKYKWIVGKYAKYNDSFITRIMAREVPEGESHRRAVETCRI